MARDPGRSQVVRRIASGAVLAHTSMDIDPRYTEVSKARRQVIGSSSRGVLEDSRRRAPRWTRSRQSAAEGRPLHRSEVDSKPPLCMESSGFQARRPIPRTCWQSGWRVRCLSPVGLCEPLVSIAEELPARLGSRGRGCGADGLGRARALGAGLRDDCGGPTRRRPLCRAGGVGPLRGSRQFPATDHRAIRRRRGAVGCGCWERRCGQRGAVRYDNRCARNLRRTGRVDRRRLAPRVSGGFVSEPVLKGFIVGLALTVMVGQIPKLFGVETGTGHFFERAWDF